MARRTELCDENSDDDDVQQALEGGASGRFFCVHFTGEGPGIAVRVVLDSKRFGTVGLGMQMGDVDDG